MLPELLICTRGSSDPQKHGGRRFWARLLRVVFLLLVYTVSLGQVGAISSGGIEKKKSQFSLLIVSGDPC